MDQTRPCRLEDIDAYISQDDPAAADRIVETLTQSVEKLADFPSLGREGLVEGTWELVITALPYVISYRVKAETVQILAVLHTARDRARTLARRAENPRFRRLKRNVQGAGGSPRPGHRCPRPICLDRSRNT